MGFDADVSRAFRFALSEKNNIWVFPDEAD